MGRLVSVVKSGAANVQLPNLYPYNVGQYAVLSDVEFATINPAAYGSDAVLSDKGAFPLVNPAGVQGVQVVGPVTTTKGADTLLNSDLAQLGLPSQSARANLGRYEPLTDVTAALVTANVTFTPVFVEKGDVVTNIIVKVGATAAGTPTHGFLALYSPAGALLAQTADFTSTAQAANATIDAALTAPQTAAASGYFYVGIGFTATAVPSLLCRVFTAGTKTIPNLSWGSVVYAQHTVGGAYGATAPATIAGATGIANSVNAPYVILH
jgi:hypothetical protein